METKKILIGSMDSANTRLLTCLYCILENKEI